MARNGFIYIATDQLVLPQLDNVIDHASRVYLLHTFALDDGLLLTTVVSCTIASTVGLGIGGKVAEFAAVTVRVRGQAVPHMAAAHHRRMLQHVSIDHLARIDGTTTLTTLACC